MVLLSFVTMVRDMGAGGYLVQEKDLTVDRIRAVWAVQLGWGMVLAILVLLASIPVASFYAEPRMRDIMLVVSLNYAINPFGSLTYAWQIREMRFDALAIVRFSATLTGAIVSVYCAWRGLGPISLAFGSLASTIVNATMAIYFRPKWFPWLPGIKEIRRVLAFGSRTTGSTIIQTVTGSAPELLLGKLQDMTAVGLFSRANGLVMMFGRLVMDGISSVAISWFAQQSRQHGNISQPFLKATSYVTALGWAFAISTVFLAHPAMRVLYGDQWDGAVDLTRMIAVALACGMPAAMCTASLMAVGAVAQVLRVTMITSVITVIAMSIGAGAGLLYLGAFQVVATLLNAIIWLRTTQRVVQFKWTEFMNEVSRSAIVGITTGVGPAIVFFLYGPYPENYWWALITGGVSASAGFLAGIIFFKHPLKDELMSLKARITLS